MVSWIWIPVFAVLGVIIGVFLIALVSMEQDREEEFFGRDWKAMNKVLGALMKIEDSHTFTKEEKENLDIAVLCVSHIMNRLRWQK